MEMHKIFFKLFTNLNADLIEETAIISQLVKYGYNKESAIKAINNNLYDPISATYRLLVEKQMKLKKKNEEIDEKMKNNSFNHSNYESDVNSIHFHYIENDLISNSNLINIINYNNNNNNENRIIENNLNNNVNKLSNRNSEEMKNDLIEIFQKGELENEEEYHHGIEIKQSYISGFVSMPTSASNSPSNSQQSSPINSVFSSPRHSCDLINDANNLIDHKLLADKIQKSFPSLLLNFENDNNNDNDNNNNNNNDNYNENEERNVEEEEEDNIDERFKPNEIDTYYNNRMNKISIDSPKKTNSAIDRLLNRVDLMRKTKSSNVSMDQPKRNSLNCSSPSSRVHLPGILNEIEIDEIVIERGNKLSNLKNKEKDINNVKGNKLSNLFSRTLDFIKKKN